MKGNTFISILVLSALLISTVKINLFAQEKNYSGITNYPISVYKANPQNWGIIEDHRGMIYFANQDGYILEYDGIEWRKISVPDLTSVRSLGIDTAGTIYVGSIDDFGYLSPDSKGNLEYVSLIHLVDSTERQFGEIWSIAVNEDEIFFQTWDVLFRLKDNKIKRWQLTDLYHRSFVVHNKFYIRQKWIGITVLENDTFRLINGGEQFAEATISAMMPFSEDKILIGTRKQGLYIYDPKNKKQPIYKFENKADNFLVQNLLYHGIHIGEDKFAFATLLNGLIIINKNGEIVRKINKSHSLISVGTYFLFCQDENILWVGQENGISKVLLNYPFKYKKNSSGISINDVIRFDKKLYIASGQGASYLALDDELSKANIKSVQGIKGMTWSLLKAKLPLDKNHNHFTNKLLLCGMDGVYEIYNTDQTINLSHLRTVFAAKQANKDPSVIFVGAKNGLYLLNWDYQTKSWSTSLIFSNNNAEIRYIVEDEDNNLWISSMYSGIYRISFSKIKSKDNEYVPDYRNTSPLKIDHYTSEHGFPSNKGIICLSFQGGPLFSPNRTLYKYNSSKNNFTPYPHIHPILAKESTIIFRFEEDSHGNIWIDSDMIFYKQPDHSFIIDTLSLKKLNDLRIDAVYPEENGITWFAGDGLFQFNKNIKVPIKLKYPALIRKVSINKDSVIFGGTNFNKLKQVSLKQTETIDPIIDHQFNSFVFEYAALFYEEEESLEYSYMLEDFDTKWSPWSTENKKEYTNLFEGEYTFKVKAKNIYDIESTIATYTFRVSPPIYRALGAYFLYLVLFILIIYVAIRIYARRLKAANIRLEQQVRERTEEIAAQRDALAAANATKDKFFAIISHDLKSPFNSILGFGEIMMESISTLSQEKIKKYVSQIYESSKKLYGLVENLLEWSRSKTGSIKNIPEKLNLTEVIHNTVDVSKISAKNKKIQLNVAIDKEIIVFADSNLISTIIRNLISNAIKYSDEEKPITISAKQIDGFAKVSVKDSGIGIKKENFKKLFREDVHYTTKGTNKEKGTGLGLIICKEFTEIIGGKMSVESEEGKGSTFYFTIPLLKK